MCEITPNPNFGNTIPKLNLAYHMARRLLRLGEEISEQLESQADQPNLDKLLRKPRYESLAAGSEAKQEN